MKIGIDGNEANVENKVGIGEYAFQLLWQLSKFKVQPFGSAAGESLKFKVYLKNYPNGDLPKETESWGYRVVKPSKFWTQLALPFDLYLSRTRPDVFLSPTHYAPRFSPVPTVISIMDLSYIFYPEMFRKSDLYQLRNWTSYSVKNAKKVITISRSSKDDIMKQYGLASDKVAVVYPGIKVKSQKSKVKSTMQKSKRLKEKYGVEGDFILFVGTLQPRKNIERLVEAFSKVSLNKDYTQLQLVIVGKKGWLYEEILASPEKFEIQDNVKFLEYVSDEELPYFYKNAMCFVLPSLYEGFGLPVLEAMKYGCPVITSNVSSLPEAGGDAAVYVDPYDVDHIAEKILEVLDNDKLRKSMIEKGYKQVKKFSWEKSARQVLGILEEVGNSK